MAYTILICDDNTLYGSCKNKIMQREKLFNKLWFLVEPHYNGYDMSKCTVTMRYLLPISKEFKTEILELSEERYEEYLKYVLPVDTNLTKEHGDIRLNLTFTMLDVDKDGNIVQRVRKTDDYILKITPIPDWDAVIPDSALSAIDQRMIKQDAQIKSLKKLTNMINENMVDNLVYNKSEDTLQLSANGNSVGNKVYVKDMLNDGIPVVNFDSDNNSDNNENKNDCNCNHDCNCEDNIVEFGYNESFVENADENNVVEF